MTCPRGDTLLQTPVIHGAQTKHVTAVIRFDDDRVASDQLVAHEVGETSKIGKGRQSNTRVFCDEAKIVDRIVRNTERFKIYIADPEFLIRFDRYGSILH